MPLISYVPKNFQGKSLEVIKHANKIIAEYELAGYDLTLRQLYYQFVARDLIQNKQSEYKRLGSIINDARLAGLIDWERIEDRTRGLETISSWSNPANAVASIAHWFKEDLWIGQPCRIEVWIEKEALAGVFERICQELRVPHLSCRGYASQSEMWRAAMRLKKWSQKGQTPVILHFGDHDPSGMDMSRDIQDRINTFIGPVVEFERLALNMDQVEQYNPPPNPAKESDIRFEGYAAEHGDQSWELDALDPAVLSELVRDAVESRIVKKKWQQAVDKEEEGKRLLQAVSGDWENLTEGL